MSIKVFTLGSCVCRDIFNHTAKEEFDVVKNIQRQSLFLSPMEGYPVKYEDIDLEKLKDHPWEIKMMVNEVNKSILDEIREVDADWLVMDMIEERFQFAQFEVDGKNYLDVKSGHFDNFYEHYLEDKAKNYKLTSIDDFTDEEVYINFEKCVDVLLKRFSIDRVILIESYYSAEMVDNEGSITKYDNQEEIARMNARLSRVNKIMKQILDNKASKDKQYTLLEAPENNLGYKNHKWGVFPVHYQDSFYEDMGDKILNLVRKEKVIEKDEFDSEFCNVKYISEDNIVFLAWKKFSCYDDYRNPTTFAYELLKKYPNSNFVVDARSGFEDEKEDVEWGFSVLLPAMSKTDCKTVIFIMNEVNEIEEEMDMWTKEFMKYFTVKRVKAYEAAVSFIKGQ